MSLEFPGNLENVRKIEEIPETTIPPELLLALRFDEFQQAIKPRYSMAFVFNGKQYHFDGVVLALATAHKDKKTEELRQFAALSGFITRLCFNFSGMQKERYLPAALVRDSAGWINRNEENNK